MPSRLGGSEILMTEAELRAKIRALMDSGILPRDLPPMKRTGPGEGIPGVQMLIGEQPEQLCTVCEERGPQIAYIYGGELFIVRLHTDCDELWQQERGVHARRSTSDQP